MDEIITLKKDVATQVIIARCQLPPIYSQGKGKTEALQAVENAVKLFVKHLFE